MNNKLLFCAEDAFLRLWIARRSEEQRLTTGANIKGISAASVSVAPPHVASVFKVDAISAVSAVSVVSVVSRVRFSDIRTPLAPALSMFVVTAGELDNYVELYHSKSMACKKRKS